MPRGAIPTPRDELAASESYGPLAALVGLFERNQIKVNVRSGMPSGLCYAVATWGSVGTVDQQSLMNITGEAWVRNPTTIVKKPGG